MATFAAVDVVVAWSVNRLGRTLTEGLHFMWLCYINDVRVFVVKDYVDAVRKGKDGSGALYDLRDDAHWDHVEEEFKRGQAESRAKSGDIARGHRDNREDGRLDGPPPGVEAQVRFGDARAAQGGRAGRRGDRARGARAGGGRSCSTVAWLLNRDDVRTFAKLKKDGTPVRKTGAGGTARRCGSPC